MYARHSAMFRSVVQLLSFCLFAINAFMWPAAFPSIATNGCSSVPPESFIVITSDADWADFMTTFNTADAAGKTAENEKLMAVLPAFVFCGLVASLLLQLSTLTNWKQPNKLMDSCRLCLLLLTAGFISFALRSSLELLLKAGGIYLMYGISQVAIFGVALIAGGAFCCSLPAKDETTNKRLPVPVVVVSNQVPKPKPTTTTTTAIALRAPPPPGPTPPKVPKLTMTATAAFVKPPARLPV